eukprot:GHVR01081914.1.p1 GENE.GHVR01081914.1~~GHVR01081914.1.p1  ORF type:complete len:337 (-),score=37.18 GHVR01081914.1:107-1117(-)
MAKLEVEDLKALAELLAATNTGKGTMDKALDMKWVPKYTGKENFRQWKFLWSTAVDAYLPASKTDDKIVKIYHAGLLKSAEGCKDFTTDIQTLIESGKKCEEVIKCLENLYMPYIEDQRLEVVRKINNFVRATNETKRSMLMRFDRLLNEATRVSYTVSEQCKLLMLLNALTSNEKELVMMHSFQKSSNEPTTEEEERLKYKIIREAVEFLTTIEALSIHKNKNERLDSAMNVVETKKKWKKYKKNAESDNKTFLDKKKPNCSKCGKWAHADISQCPAINQECRICGKKGHFEKVCRNKVRKEQANNIVQTTHHKTVAKTNTPKVSSAATDLTSSF